MLDKEKLRQARKARQAAKGIIQNVPVDVPSVPMVVPTKVVYGLTNIKPTKLDSKTFPVLIELLKKGNTVDVAASIVGISTDLMRKYLAFGHQEYVQKQEQLDSGELDEEDIELSIQAQLYYIVTQAQAQNQSELLQVITGHGKLNWQAAAWILERRHSKQWGKKPTTTNTKEIKHTIKTTAVPVSRATGDDAFLEMAKQQKQIAESTTTVKMTETTEIPESDEIADLFD